MDDPIRFYILRWVMWKGVMFPFWGHGSETLIVFRIQKLFLPLLTSRWWRTARKMPVLGALSSLKTLFGILLCGGSEVALTVALLTLASNAEPQASQKCYTLCTVYWKHKVLYRPCHHFPSLSCLVHVTLRCFRGLYTRMLLFSACIYILFKLWIATLF